jgi:hypothetical protein
VQQTDLRTAVAGAAGYVDRILKGPDKPVISYAYPNDGAPRYKLPAAMAALWRNRSKKW